MYTFANWFTVAQNVQMSEEALALLYEICDVNPLQSLFNIGDQVTIFNVTPFTGIKASIIDKRYPILKEGLDCTNPLPQWIYILDVYLGNNSKNNTAQYPATKLHKGWEIAKYLLRPNYSTAMKILREWAAEMGKEYPLYYRINDDVIHIYSEYPGIAIGKQGHRIHNYTHQLILAGYSVEHVLELTHVKVFGGH